MVWIVILVVVAVMGVAIFFALKAHNKMVAEGKIISRRPDFMENAEEFILSPVDPASVTEAVKGFDYQGMHTSMKGSSEKQIFQFSGNGWESRLYRLPAEETQSVYRFEFTHWKTNSGMSMPQGALDMNKLTTAVEKAFLNLDPHTQVRTVPLELHTKHSIL